MYSISDQLLLPAVTALDILFWFQTSDRMSMCRRQGGGGSYEGRETYYNNKSKATEKHSLSLSIIVKNILLYFSIMLPTHHRQYSSQGKHSSFLSVSLIAERTPLFVLEIKSGCFVWPYYSLPAVWPLCWRSQVSAVVKHISPTRRLTALG